MIPFDITGLEQHYHSLFADPKFKALNITIKKGIGELQKTVTITDDTGKIITGLINDRSN